MTFQSRLGLAGVLLLLAGTAHAQPAPKVLTPEEAEAARRADEVGAVPAPAADAPRAIWFAGDLAFTRADLGLLHDGLAFDRTGANGLRYGVSGGVRFGQWRLGLRWRITDTTQFTLWTFGLEAGYILKLQKVTPILSAHLGYVFDEELQRSLFKSHLPPGNVIPPDVDTKGIRLGVDAQAAWPVQPWLRVGPFVGVDATYLFRARSPAPQSIYGPVDTTGDALYSRTGHGLGLDVNVGLRGSFDIGFR